MYNGIGLQTPRGSGTNGHVQRNWAIVRKTKDRVDYKSEEKGDQLNKQPNKEILDHVRKRKVEVKCAELMDILEDQGLTPEEIKSKVATYREMLMGSDAKPQVPTDDFGRVNVRETHQVAEAQQEKNAKLREAFGISEYFVEGSSLDPERHAREAEARAAAGKVYELVHSPSPPPVEEAPATDKKNQEEEISKQHQEEKIKEAQEGQN
uniref:SRRM2 protein n=1 Tax=Fopius arisanus TaxID=64838 RepID=A0A0C9PRV7_9HYME